MTLDKQLKKQLTAKSQQIKPIVIIGNNGLTENVLAEIVIGLDAHELIKIRINAGDKEDRQTITTEICEKTQAQLIQRIGHVISIYRKKQDA